MRLRSSLLVVTVLVFVAVYVVFVSTPSGAPSLRTFEPDRVADLEVDLWQAYYSKENVRLFRGLVILLREQNRYTWARAGQAAFYLARAAARFADMRDGYERVLPDLERAYTIERGWMKAGFDPSAVARAELAWWVARRIPAQNSVEQVGTLIADENALRYEVPRESVLEASMLRARAAKLRDDGGVNADWARVSALLHESHRRLHAAVQR